MKSERNPDKTKRLDIDSEGCKDIWIVNEQIEANEDEDDAAVAVGQRKSKQVNFNLFEIKTFHQGNRQDRKIREFKKKVENQSKEEDERYDKQRVQGVPKN